MWLRLGAVWGIASSVLISSPLRADFAVLSDVSSMPHEDSDLIPLNPIRPLNGNTGEDFLGGSDYAELVALSDSNLGGMPSPDEQEIGLVNMPPEAEDHLWRIRPQVSVGITYDDNIFITNTDRLADLIYNIDVGFGFELGDYRERKENFLILKYLASASYFGRYTNQNTVNQSGSFSGQYCLAPMTMQVDSEYQYINGADRDVGSFTKRTIFNNTLRFLYPYSNKTDLDLEFNQRSTFYPNSLSNYSYEVQPGFDYNIFSKTQVGVEGILGLAEVQEGPDMWYQTINGRLNYSISGKFMLKAKAGLQLSEYASGGQDLTMISVFSLGGDYQLLPKTTLRFNAYRRMQTSGIAGQDFIATGGEFFLGQNYSEKLMFSISTGYENDVYVPRTSTVEVNREDNFLFFRPKISYLCMKKMQLSLSYEYKVNNSSEPQSGWYSNRINFEISYDF